SELFEKVELAIEDVRLDVVVVDVALKGGREFFLRLVRRDEPARLDEGLLVPTTEEVGSHLGLPAVLRLLHAAGGEDRRTDCADETDGSNRGRNRGDLLGPVRRAHRSQLRAFSARRRDLRPAGAAAWRASPARR